MVDNKKLDSDIKEKLVAINRITKVVKGGRRFGFAALVVVGNQKGSVGIGQGKSKQVPDAIKKATEVASERTCLILYTIQYIVYSIQYIVCSIVLVLVLVLV